MFHLKYPISGLDTAATDGGHRRCGEAPHPSAPSCVRVLWLARLAHGCSKLCSPLSLQLWHQALPWFSHLFQLLTSFCLRPFTDFGWVQFFQRPRGKAAPSPCPSPARFLPFLCGVLGLGSGAPRPRLPAHARMLLPLVALIPPTCCPAFASLLLRLPASLFITRFPPAELRKRLQSCMR